MDYGILRQVPEPFADVGMADAIEGVSIEDAEKICLRKSIKNYLILNDNVGAVTRKGNSNVQWFRGMHYSTRVKETDTANSVNWSSMMLARLTAYPSYCRQSKRRGTKRHPTALNAELFRMFVSRELEFQLSDNILWGNIKRLVDSKLTSAKQGEPTAGKAKKSSMMRKRGKGREQSRFQRSSCIFVI
jgi:hypothetical protein